MTRKLGLKFWEKKFLRHIYRIGVKATNTIIDERRTFTVDSFVLSTDSLLIDVFHLQVTLNGNRRPCAIIKRRPDWRRCTN
uniref:Uncharacterized protein n=1 Tax=Romanomermis culicivorax TaxID=13658 RepID=A0A915K9S4_ROMCU